MNILFVSHPSQILLKWNSVNDDATGYSIELLIDGTFQRIATNSINDTTYMDTGLLSSTEYTYRIRSFNSEYISEPSTEIKIATSESRNGEVLIALNAGGPTFTSVSGIQVYKSYKAILICDKRLCKRTFTKYALKALCTKPM